MLSVDGGGATVAQTRAVNSRAGHSRETGPEVWKSYGVSSVLARRQTLEVVIPRSPQDYPNIRVRPIEGVTVVTTVIDGTSKREVFEAAPIEVQSESANPGS